MLSREKKATQRAIFIVLKPITTVPGNSTPACNLVGGTPARNGEGEKGSNMMYGIILVGSAEPSCMWLN